MFRRKLQIDVVKKSKKQDTDLDQDEVSLERKVEIATDVIEGSIKKIGIAVCAFVVLDTVRQVVVKSMTPE